MSALLISCSDGRLKEPLERLLRRLHADDAHRLLVPGGPLVLTDRGERRVALECIELIVEAHHVKRIMLVSHQGCSAYDRKLGGLGFDQQEILRRDLEAVKGLLEDTHRGVAVDCFVIPWQENRDGSAGYGDAVRVGEAPVKETH